MTAQDACVLQDAEELPKMPKIVWIDGPTLRMGLLVGGASVDENERLASATQHLHQRSADLAIIDEQNPGVGLWCSCRVCGDGFGFPSALVIPIIREFFCIVRPCPGINTLQTQT